MLTNYHTHCDLCKHAEGNVEDYVKQAVKDGFDVLGMSDHVPYPDYDYGYRMEFAEIWDYICDVRDAQKKYGGRLRILLGFESEYMREYLAMRYEELELAGCELETEIPEDVVIMRFDGSQLKRVFENIINNSLRHNSGSMTIFTELSAV